MAPSVARASFPGWLLALSLALVLSTASVAALAASRTSVEHRRIQDQYLPLVETHGTLLRLDEALTMSARAAVWTGDVAWVRRYDAHEAEANAALRELDRLQPPPHAGSAQLKQANARLVDMEREALGLVAAGRAEEGRRLLESAAYAAEKQRYTTALTLILRSAREDVNATVAQAGQHLWRLGAAATTLSAVSAGISVLAYARVRSWRDQTLRAQRDRDAARRDAEQAMERAARTEQLALLGSMSAGVAHEINNPLTFMRVHGYTFLLATERMEARAADPDWKAYLAQARKFADVNRDGIGRIASIVGSMHLLAKPQPPTSVVPLRRVVDATVALAGAKLSKNAQVQVDVPADLATRGSADRLGQIFLNLVLNASQAIPAAGGRIALTGWRAGGRVHVAVEDNGPGVAPEVRPRLFTPFVTTKPDGTGIGLSISQRIAEEHGGRIRLEPGSLGGARFVLDLPDAMDQPTS